MEPQRKKVLLSFDIEEFDLPLEYGIPIDSELQNSVSREGLISILDTLESLNLRSTFFSTVVFANNNPDLIRRITAYHELASHGWEHSHFSDDDLLRSRLELERLFEVPVRGFRRARFGDFNREKLRSAGYTYDSSENPIFLPGRYNNLGCPRKIHEANGIIELPISSSPGIRYPLFWLSFKHTPMSFFRLMSKWSLETDGYLNIFFHPWEFSNLKKYGLPWIIRRLDGNVMLQRLNRYLLWLKSMAEFETMGSFVDQYQSR